MKPNSAERNLRRGIALVPEGRGILGSMSVEENLLMGLYTRADKAQGALDLAAMFERFPILAERRHVFASLLSGGEQQMLAIARALLSKPRLLLLDEPSLGLAPKMTAAVFQMIQDLRREGLTVLLVEQKARQTLKIADRAYLMETGRVVTSGPARSAHRRSRGVGDVPRRPGRKHGLSGCCVASRLILTDDQGHIQFTCHRGNLTQ